MAVSLRASTSGSELFAADSDPPVTTMDVTIPSNQSGDLVFVAIFDTNEGTWPAPSGWTKFNEGDGSLHLFVADGGTVSGTVEFELPFPGTTFAMTVTWMAAALDMGGLAWIFDDDSQDVNEAGSSTTADAFWSGWLAPYRQFTLWAWGSWSDVDGLTSFEPSGDYVTDIDTIIVDFAAGSLDPDHDMALNLSFTEAVTTEEDDLNIAHTVTGNVGLGTVHFVSAEYFFEETTAKSGWGIVV